MKIAICDDEQNDLSLLQQYCVRFDSSVQAESFENGQDLLNAFRNRFFDVVFLDIEMPGLDGFAIGTELIKLQPAPIIIFTTHSLNYAVRGYGIAFRYLPKPISYETFVGTMRLVTEKVSLQQLSLPFNGGESVLHVSDITFFEVIQHTIDFHLKDGHSVTVRGSLADYKEKLSRFWFVQPHKSYCVNLDYIDHITLQNITLSTGDIIPIGRSLSKSFRTQFELYMKGLHSL